MNCVLHVCPAIKSHWLVAIFKRAAIRQTARGRSLTWVINEATNLVWSRCRLLEVFLLLS